MQRREPLTASEAAYLTDRFGRRSLQAMSAMAGVSQASLRRTVPLAEHGATADPPGPTLRRPRAPGPTPPFRIASLSLVDAAREVGLTVDALCAWLIQERWIRRGPHGVLIAGATKLTASYLNQPVEQVEVGCGVRMLYGAIRFTPRGLANLRASLDAGGGVQ